MFYILGSGHVIAKFHEKSQIFLIFFILFYFFTFECNSGSFWIHDVFCSVATKGVK